MFILQLIIIIFLIFTIYNIIEIQKFNKNGFIIELINLKENNSEKIKDAITLLNPILLIIKNETILYNDLISNNLNYIMNNYSLKKVNDLEQIHIFKDKNICEDLNLKEKINFNLDIFENFYIPLLFNKKHYLSIFKGYNIIPLQFCKHNVNIIYILEGKITLYLFNPKHKNVIINKNLESIKKYAHKYYLEKDNFFIIPPNWYYIQESNDTVLQYYIESDNYFTALYNLIR